MVSGPTIYYITPELWAGYSSEQLALQVERLKSTGRYRLPASFTVRVDFESIVDMARYRVRNPGYVRELDTESYFDFRYAGGKLIGIDHSIVRVFPTAGPRTSASWRLECVNLHRGRDALRQPELYRLDEIAAWWIDDKKLETCFPLDMAHYDGEILAEYTRDCDYPRNVLACILYDRTVLRVECEPRNQPQRRAFFSSTATQQRVQQITMYVPRRISTTDHGGTHASPHMHFRAEHDRNQPYGPRSNPSYRKITIPGKWINATDIDPSELGTPPRTVTLRGM
jgi:hypothetical protein